MQSYLGYLGGHPPAAPGGEPVASRGGGPAAGTGLMVHVEAEGAEQLEVEEHIFLIYVVHIFINSNYI